MLDSTRVQCPSGGPVSVWTQLILFQLVNTKNITPLPRYSVFKPFAETMSSQVWSHNVCFVLQSLRATLAGQPRGAQKECRQIQENQPQAAGGQEQVTKRATKSWSDHPRWWTSLHVPFHLIFIQKLCFILLQYYVNHVTSKWLHSWYAPAIFPSVLLVQCHFLPSKCRFCQVRPALGANQLFWTCLLCLERRQEFCPTRPSRRGERWFWEVMTSVL